MKILKKLLIGLVSLAVIFIVIGWLAFIPSAKEPDYEMSAMWGEKGTGPGQFDDPTGIAISGDEVFVADSRNNRIQVFNLDGKFLRTFGTAGDKAGQLGRPMNLTIVGDELYVPEYFNDRIQVFSLQGKSKRIIGKAGSGPGEFNAPGGVGIARDGKLYVADFYNHRIQILDRDGSFISQLGTTGKAGIWASQFGYPTDVAVSGNGKVYVADGYNDRIQVFKSGGEFLSKWGGPFAMNIFGPFKGWFATVTSVMTDKKGNVYAADFYNHRIQKFTLEGGFLTSFGTKGSAKAQFFHPIATAVAADGSVYVADFGNNRIQKWQQKK